MVDTNLEIKSWTLDSGNCPEYTWHHECRWCGRWLSFNDRQQPKCPYCHKGDVKEEGR